MDDDGSSSPFEGDEEEEFDFGGSEDGGSLASVHQLMDDGDTPSLTEQQDEEEEEDGEEHDVRMLGRTYQVLSMEDVVAGQHAKVDKIHEGIAKSFARILLVHYAWDEDKLLGHFFERGIEYVYKSAGVVPDKDEREEQESDDTEVQRAVKHQKKEVPCESCMDDVTEDNTTKLNCGHRFCNDCYQTYVAMKINEGQANAIACMAYKCNTKLDETFIPKLVQDPVVLQKYNKTLAESYVNDNPRVKWCTSVPHCGNAIEVLWGKQVEVQCECHHRFCFNCVKDPHSPLPCKLLPEWMEKCEGEGESIKYITANTKNCPKCHSAVEKNGGCNLMSCRCGTFFCWLCGAQTGQAHTWERVAGHSCGKYQEKEKNADAARVSLERYMHYYIRYKAHSDSSVLEAQMRMTLLEKVAVLLEKSGTFTAYEEKWLARALDMLFECRRILKWSYALAYFIFGEEGKRVDYAANKAHKMLFEDHQEQLEITTEVLSKKLETPLPDMDPNLHLDIMNITVLAQRRCKGLFDIVISDILANGAYGFDISPYSFSLELSSLHARPEREQLSGEQEAQHNKGQGIPNEEVPPAATPRRTANRRRKREEAGPISRRPQAGLPQPKNKRAEEAELRRALELSRQGMQQGFMEDKQAKGRVDMDDAEQEMIRQAIDASLTDM